ncbi:hypothetical protein ACQKM2_19905 [Streptomyces sp. NPDC004126]|uniref:hypothetical protein n=1 Tax=Streptomyces sp. NPDC004126 TaxID=3390695 RepID=UPI003D021E4E
MSSDVMAKNQGLSCAVPVPVQVQDGPESPMTAPRPGLAGPPGKRRRKRYAAQRARGREGASGAVGPASPAGARGSSRAPARAEAARRFGGATGTAPNAGRCGCRLSASSGLVTGPTAVETGDSAIRQPTAVEGG